MFPGIASTVMLKTSCSSRPPSRTPAGSPRRWSGTSALDRDVAADADEVDVHELAPRGVALDLPDEREHGVAVDFEVDQRVGAALAGEDVRQLASGHGDVDRVVVEAVDDGGDAALPAEAPGRAGSELGPRVGGEDDVGHGDAGLSEPGIQRRSVEQRPGKGGDAGADGTAGESTGCRPGTAR